MSSTSQVDNELAALKAELGTGGGDTAALPSADAGGPTVDARRGSRTGRRGWRGA